MTRNFLFFLLSLSLGLCFSQNARKLQIPDSLNKKSQEINEASHDYLSEGNYYYLRSNYSKSLDNYLLARDLSKNNIDKFNTVNFNIGLLKLEIGDFEEAQKLFLNYKKYLEDNNLTNRNDYISCLYALATTNTKGGNYDQSDFYIELGLEKNKKINSGENYSNLLLVSGINQFERKNYNQSIITLKKTSKIITDNSYNAQNLALSEFYIGMGLYRTNNSNFLNNFKIVDSLNINTKSASRDLISIYPILIEYYKKKDNKERQLYFIEHLLVVDNILNKNNGILSSEISKKYDIPILLKEKEKLISDLSFINSIFFLTISVIAVLFISFLIFYNNKIKKFKRQAILLTKTNEFVIQNKIMGKKIPSIEISIKNELSKSTISEDLLKFLSLKLIEFENNKGFLNRDVTLYSLAKELDTNRDYLSKAVNDLKSKNFPQYINELRINYLIEQLKVNPKLQMLTIAGMAEEAGFKNSESFANSFKKITGTLPSYYLKALKKIKR